MQIATTIKRNSGARLLYLNLFWLVLASVLYEILLSTTRLSKGDALTGLIFLLPSGVALIGLWWSRSLRPFDTNGKAGYAFNWLHVLLIWPLAHCMAFLLWHLWAYLFFLMAWLACLVTWVQVPARSVSRALMTALAGTMLTTPLAMPMIVKYHVMIDPPILALLHDVGSPESTLGQNGYLGLAYAAGQLILSFAAFLIVYWPSNSTALEIQGGSVN